MIGSKRSIQPPSQTLAVPSVHNFAEGQISLEHFHSPSRLDALVEAATPQKNQGLAHLKPPGIVERNPCRDSSELAILGC